MKKLLFISMILLFSMNAQAQIPRLGGNKVATSSAQFLKIGVGARAVSMGESFVAIADDASALFWNPAGAALTPDRSAFFSHTDWAVDIDYDYFAYIQNLSNFGRLGVSFGTLYTDDMPITDEYHPDGTGAFFSYSDLFLGITYAKALTDRFAMGTTVKFIQEDLADLKSKSWAVDLGTHYNTGFKTIRFAVSIVNFGPNIKPKGKTTAGEEYEDFSPPTIFRFGIAFDPYFSSMHKITTTMQVNHPVDNAEDINIGTEYWWRQMLALRAGYRTGADEGGLSAGMGILLTPPVISQLILDYAYSDFGRLGSVQRFSLGLSF